jgi:phosphotransferase system HPr (HPr) family protein
MVMIIEKTRFTHLGGLHARPSAQLAITASKFNAEIYIRKNFERANLKDILAVLSLGVNPGEVILEAEGPQAKDALKAIKEIFKTDFDDFK